MIYMDMHGMQPLGSARKTEEIERKRKKEVVMVYICITKVSMLNVMICIFYKCRQS